MLPEANVLEMNCRYCGTRIGEEDHRCSRCGRRPGDTLTATAPVMTGAVAPKLEPIDRREAGDPATKTKRVAPRLARPIQTELFGPAPDSKVIPIARYAP